MNYDEILDAEMHAFIADTAAYYPPDATNMSVAEQRAVYDALCRAFHQGRPEGVRAEDAVADGVPVRIYRTADAEATVAYFHGGGFILGGVESHDDVCAEICDRTGFRVVSVDYRLAPEHFHPAAFDDCLAATRWTLAAFGGAVVLAGDSAGGTLASSVAHALRGETDRVRGQLLIYPALGSDMDSGAWLEHAEAPMLTREDALFYTRLRTGDGEPVRDWTYAVLHDRDFAGVPPTVVVAAALDPLVDDGRMYRDALRAAGGRAAWFSEVGLVHGYLRARTMSAKARRSFDRIVSDIRSLGCGIWPYD